MIGHFLDECIGAVGDRHAAGGGGFDIDTIHADAAQHDAAAAFRKGIDDLLGEAHTLGIDRVGVLREGDEPVLVGRAFDDFRAEIGEVFHFVSVVAGAGGREAETRGGRHFEFCHFHVPIG